MQILLRQLSGLHCILEPLVAAQGVPFALEADGGPPCAFADFPVHAGYAAGVVPAHSLGLQHLHAGSVHIGQCGEPGIFAAAAAAFAAAEMVSLDHGFPAAVAPAEPCGPPPDVFCGPERGEAAEPLPG